MFDWNDYNIPYENRAWITLKAKQNDQTFRTDPKSSRKRLETNGKSKPQHTYMTTHSSGCLSTSTKNDGFKLD